MYKICHTEESSRRQRELEHGLLDAMNCQSYNKITLIALCKQLNVPRKTFYKYFPTKQDCLLALIDHTLIDCNNVALAGWNGGDTLDSQAQIRFFQYWKENSDFLNAIRDNGLQSLLMDRTVLLVDRMKENAPTKTFALEQVEYFVAYGLMSTMLRWHQYGFQSTPEEMGEVFNELLTAARVSLSRLLI
ncbi:MAG: TetR/AcrR family transcriptional regulator [Oscillospiraceae bacterium]|nr:TetR/AcrR family transcriptional regulator [Oscillospiraceae bacterium]